MKALRKNLYAFLAIALCIIAACTLGLFLVLFSASTAVDGTTVGNIYVGDKKEESDLKKALNRDVDSWKRQAIYTITYQNEELVIGRKVDTDEYGAPKKDENGEIQYTFSGLYFLTFDYETTKKYMKSDASNEAYFKIDAVDDLNSRTKLFFDELEETFGKEITSKDNFYFSKLIDDIEKNAKAMNSIADFNLYDYVSEGWKEGSWTAEVKNLSQDKVDELYDLFKDKTITILPQKETANKLGFSAIEYFSQDEFGSLTSADMSIIATGIAGVVRETSLTVTLKNQGFISDRYYAIDGVMTARVNVKDGTDLRIVNPETSSYNIEIEKGKPAADGSSSLKFVMKGCKFINKYTCDATTLVDKEIDYKVNYAATSSLFDYEQYLIDNPEKVGIDNDFNGGVYYYIETPGKATHLYSFKRIVKHVNGTEEEFEMYPKQEFFEGNDEIRLWQYIN